jgi:hypothetical protein
MGGTTKRATAVFKISPGIKTRRPILMVVKKETGLWMT